MTTDLVTTEWFDHQKESRGLRFIQHEGITYVPILDLASATGMRKRSLLKVVSKNPIAFEKHTKSLHLETVSGLQETSCLDRDGAMLLMFKISTNSIRNPETKARLGEFQKWQITKMNQPIALPSPENKGPDYSQCLIAVKFAQELSRIVDTDPLPLVRQALDHYDLGMYGGLIKPRSFMERIGLTEKPALPPAPPKPKDYLTATDIGERIGKSAEEVHIWMYQRKPPLIVRDDVSGWRITTWGKDFGEERAVELTGGTVVWRIKWKRDVLRLFNVYDHEEMG